MHELPARIEGSRPELFNLGDNSKGARSPSLGGGPLLSLAMINPFVWLGLGLQCKPLEPIAKLGPRLHHAYALGPVLGSIIGAAPLIWINMGKLPLYHAVQKAVRC